jgi:hypothetical protein
MTDPTEAAGTTKPEGGDAAAEEQTTATPSDAGRDDASPKTVAVPEHEFAAWKTKAERTNALEEENARLKAALSPAAPTDKPDVRSRAKTYADQGDAAAELGLSLAEQLDQQERGAALLYELMLIPDIEERERVRLHFKAHPGRFVDINQARNDLRTNSLEDENKKLKEELKRATRKMDPDTVHTEDREVTAREHKTRTMTRAEWKAEQESLADDPETRMARQRAVRLGQIVVRG